MQLNFEIDKLTHSLEDILTGEILATEVAQLEQSDLQFLTKKKGWKFNWKTEFSDKEKLVYKLVLQRQPNVIQGLVCFKIELDHVFMDLIETAPHNYGSNKRYNGVMGNLVAYGCKIAFIKGFDGEIAFIAKTKLIPHYQEKLGAEVFGGQRMGIRTNAAINLVKRYYPDFFNK